MKASKLPVHISFEGTVMLVDKLRAQGRVIYNISFADGRPGESITRKKDVAGYYWISLLRADSRMAELIGRRIIEHALGPVRRRREH